MTRKFVSALVSAVLLATTLAPSLAQARSHHDNRWDDDRRGDHMRADRHDQRHPHWNHRHHSDWGRGYASRRQPHIVYYDRRPDVVYVSGRPHRYHYNPHRRAYYYRDDNGQDVMLGVALGAIGLAAILGATR